MISKEKIGKYLLYALGEIVLVVIGILIALQINNWNNQRNLDKLEITTYSNIKQQILDDREKLEEVIAYNDYYRSHYRKANEILLEQDRTKIDTLAFITMELSRYSDFHSSGNIYGTLVNSGDIKLLKNHDISRKIQNLEMTYNFINKLEDINWEIIINELSTEFRGVMNYTTFQIHDPDKLYASEIHNIFMEVIGLSESKDQIYKKALGEIDDIVAQIDLELNNSE